MQGLDEPHRVAGPEGVITEGVDAVRAHDREI
jgi:hypothetical protein